MTASASGMSCCFTYRLQNKHNEEVRRSSGVNMVNGHILALPFSDRYADAVAEAVLNTGIHKIADDRCERCEAVWGAGAGGGQV